MQEQCSQGQCSHLPLEGTHQEGEGLLTWSLPTRPCPFSQCLAKPHPLEYQPGLGESLVFLGQWLG